MKPTFYAAACVLSVSAILASPASAQMRGNDESRGAPSYGSNDYDAGFEDGLRAAKRRMENMAQSGEDGAGSGMKSMKMKEHMRSMRGMGGYDHEVGGIGPRVGLVRGDSRLWLRCASDDTTDDCVDAAIALLDRAMAAKKEPGKAEPQPPAQPGPTPPQSGR